MKYLLVGSIVTFQLLSQNLIAAAIGSQSQNLNSLQSFNLEVFKESAGILQGILDGEVPEYDPVEPTNRQECFKNCDLELYEAFRLAEERRRAALSICEESFYSRINAIPDPLRPAYCIGKTNVELDSCLQQNCDWQLGCSIFDDSREEKWRCEDAAYRAHSDFLHKERISYEECKTNCKKRFAAVAFSSVQLHAATDILLTIGFSDQEASDYLSALGETPTNCNQAVEP